MKSTLSRSFTLPLTITATAAALMLASTAHAAEGRGQRYSPGVGGSDMTSMLVPGWYGQVALLHYHATKLKGNDGKDVSALPGTSGNVPAAGLGALGAVPAFGSGINYSGKLNKFRADGYVALPRITFISGRQVLGGHLGFTAMLPLIKRQTAVSAVSELALTPGQIATVGASPVAAAGVEAAQASISQQVNAGVGAQLNGSNFGVGDLEISPVLHWEIGDHQSVTLAPTVIFPTGEYNTKYAVNPGFGNFYTFRPSIQYGFIGDGWDVGARAVLSFNTRNKDTKYRSGNMFNLDAQFMKFVTEDVRVGVQGYVVQQLTKDRSDVAEDQALIDATGGSKMRAYALGPAVAWLKNGGEMLIEGKVLQEFGAKNRTEGTSFWLTVSKPLGDL